MFLLLAQVAAEHGLLVMMACHRTYAAAWRVPLKPRQDSVFLTHDLEYTSETKYATPSSPHNRPSCAIMIPRRAGETQYTISDVCWYAVCRGQVVRRRHDGGTRLGLVAQVALLLQYMKSYSGEMAREVTIAQLADLIVCGTGFLTSCVRNGTCLPLICSMSRTHRRGARA
jgi:hypothetical protein